MKTHSNARQALGLALAGFVLFGTANAYAEDNSVAIVEDTSGAIAGIEPLDLLRAGREIELAADAGLILSYLNSCQRENIRGGKITIGHGQSEVKGGNVTRKRVPCDPAALDLTPEQANQSATLVFRKPPLEEGAKFLMDSRQPLVIAPHLKTVKLEDLRHPGKVSSITVVNGVADLTAESGLLDQGGLYQLSGGGKSVVFLVGKEATDAPLPILQRAIRL
ncbi:hypothetical protein [Dongia sp.]|jgi:hypothetical protein|uniref:hypothetical protein n=1 Tax=Dongia sp. TaxID=1977262 RepID=UPI0035B03BFF